MKKKNKTRVYEVYDEIIDWFDEHRTKTLMEEKYLNLILSQLPEKGSLLDLGCGTGEPIAKFFIEHGINVTGVDGSKKMIARCEERFPNARWIVSDMRAINFKASFDAIIAWHSFFHLDAISQRNMFAVFSAHLKRNGLLAFTSGDDEGEVWSDNGGELLYHASLSAAEYERLLKSAKFKIIEHIVRDPSCGEATIWIAQKT